MEYIEMFSYFVAVVGLVYAFVQRFKVKEVETVIALIRAATDEASDGGSGVSTAEAIKIVNTIVRIYKED